MKINKSLSIAIPSFNRPEILRRSLSLVIDELLNHSVGIYVSDDSDNEEVSNMIKESFPDYKNIFYYQNYPSLGHDKNFIKTLNLPSSEYIWLLGDSVGISPNAIEQILKVIRKHNPEILAVNYRDRITGGSKEYKSMFHKDPKEVFNLFAWHLTQTGVTIYSKKAIKYLNKLEIENKKAICSNNFPQISLIFNFLSTNCSFYWVNSNLIYSSGTSQSYWQKETLNTFITDWEQAISDLPEVYDLSLKQKVIKEHSKKTNIFSAKNLLKIRSKGAFDKDSLKKFRSKLDSHSRLPYFLLLFISSIPPRLLRAPNFIKLLRKNYTKKES